MDINLSTLLKEIKEKDKRYSSVQKIRKSLSVEVDPPIDLVISYGFVPILHEFLADSSNSAIQYESSWALTNIASGSPDHTSLIVEYEIHKTFIDLLSCDTSIELKEQNIWAIGNIIGDSPENRDLVLKEGIVDRIIEIIDTNTKVSLISNVAWTISNICRGSPRPDFNKTKPLLPAIEKLLTKYPDSDDILSDTLWALSFLTELQINETEVFVSIIDQGLVPIIISIVEKPYKISVITPGFRVLGNLLSGSDTVTQELLDKGVLAVFDKFLNSPRVNLVKEAYWCLSNITSGNSRQIQILIDQQFLKKTLDVVLKNKHSNVEVYREVLWTIINAISGGTSLQIDYLIRKNCIYFLSKLFSVAQSQNNLFNYYIEAIIIILKQGQDYLEQKDYPIFFKYFRNSFLLDRVLEMNFTGQPDLYNRLLQSIYLLRHHIEIEKLDILFLSKEFLDTKIAESDQSDESFLDLEEDEEEEGEEESQDSVIEEIINSSHIVNPLFGFSPSSSLRDEHDEEDEEEEDEEDEEEYEEYEEDEEDEEDEDEEDEDEEFFDEETDEK